MNADANGRPRSQDLSGEMFIDSFNHAKYPQDPVNTYDAQPFGYTTTGFDTLASSPEQSYDLHQNTPGSNNDGATNTADAGGSNLNPRSCVTCRRRKVRCNKTQPKCGNCLKASIDCIYPPPGRAPRKPRRPQDAELLKRLRRLESVVDSLGAQVDEDGHVHETDTGRKRSTSEDLFDVSSDGPSRRTSLEYGIGKLMIKDGRSRYVSNDFWHTLGQEIAEIRDGLDTPSSDEDNDEHSPGGLERGESKIYAHHEGFIFGYSSLMYDMTRLQPNPSQIWILWETYKENVDPILKILHAPTVKNVIMKAAVSTGDLSKASEALFYSICFASVVSMTEDQCKQLMGETKAKLMQKFRFACEQALARAQFLNSSNLMILQAFVMFIMVVKYIDTSRSIWSLAGLALQQAHSQGLHRDPSNFRVSPFETEMRRRLWWHISLQDARATEDYGADPTFYQTFFDTKLPLNVNDADIWPEMTETPQSRTGATDMTFCMIRFELAHMQRSLRVKASSESDDDKRRTIGDKERAIDVTHQRMQEKYFRYCDPNNPLLWVASTIGKLILAKMWLFVHHPRLLQKDDQQGADDLKEQVFMTSVEVVEFGTLLERGKHTSKWSWMFRTYQQWHAVAYVLSELCTRPVGPVYDRAWAAVDAVYDTRMLDLPKTARGVLWRPLKQLHTRAQARRQQLSTTSSPQSNPNSDRSMHTTTSQGTETPSMGMINGNFLGTNPYVNAVSAAGDTFDLDFNDPAFNEPAMQGGFNFSIPMSNPQIPQPLKTPLDAIPFGWNTEVADYFDFGGQAQSYAWQPQMQQEWH